MAKTPKTISSFWEKGKSQTSPELIMRESFLRAVRETLDNFGIDRYSIERIEGMREMLEKYVEIEEENS